MNKRREWVVEYWNEVRSTWIAATGTRRTFTEASAEKRAHETNPRTSLNRYICQRMPREAASKEAAK